MEPKVSIIIPTYNRVSLIGQTLESILSQTYQDWECMVIDDGSKDYTPELIEFYKNKDSRLQYFFRPSNYPKGANACRNYGLELSKGDYINWFDSDDIMEPTKLEKQVTILENELNHSACISPYKLCNQNMGILKEMPLFYSKHLLLDYLTEGSFFNFQSVLFRKSSLGIKPDLNLYKAQELEFFTRYLREPGLEVIILLEYLVKVRLHEDNITSKFEAGDVKAINSEMDVRLKSLKVLREIGSSKDLNAGLQLYGRFLLSLLKQNNIGLYFKYVFKLFVVLPAQYFLRVLKAFFLGFIQLIFKKQPYRFRKILNFTT